MIEAECREITADEARAAALAARLGTTGALAAAAARAAGRRGPGLPGSAQVPRRVPGPSGRVRVRHAAGCRARLRGAGPVRRGRAGGDGAYSDVSDDELIGLICAWDRVQAHGSARKHAMAAELIRRRPAPGCVLRARRGCRPGGRSSPRMSWLRRWPSRGGRRTPCWAWRMTWRSSCPAPGPRSGPGCCRRTRRGSSPRPPSCWTLRRPAPPRPWCWAGPGG